MAYATREDATETPFSSETTAHAANYPATVNAGDLLIAGCGLHQASGGAPTITTPSGWTQLEHESDGTSISVHAVYAKVAAGTEDGGTEDFETNEATSGVITILRYSSWYGSLDGVASSSVGSPGETTATPDTPSLTPSWSTDETTWVAIATGVDDDQEYTSAPTNYGNLTSRVSGGGTNAGAEVGTADRQNETGTEDPGTWTCESSERHYVFLVAIAPSGASFPNFPDVLSVTETQVGTPSTTHNVAMPATVDAGDLLIALITYFDPSTAFTASTPSGWTELWDSEDFASIGDGQQHIFAKDADGDEDGGTVNFATSETVNAAAQVYRIAADDWGGTLASHVAVGVGVDGSGTAPNPPSLTSGFGSVATLWIAVASSVDDDISASSQPSGYSGLETTVSGGGGNNGPAIHSAYLQATAATENPGAFTIASTEALHANTIAVHPAVAAATVVKDIIGGGIIPFAR